MRSVWLGLVLAVACSGGAGDRHPAMPAEGGSSTGGKSAQPAAGKAAIGDAGAAGDSAGRGGAGEGGASDGGVGAVLQIGGATEQAPLGVCPPTLELGQAEAQEVGAAAITLLSMTADERSVAFTTGTGDQLVLHVADRATASGDFTDAIVALPDGFEAASGVSLAGDGLKLVIVMSDHTGFAELSRATRSAAFAAEADLTAFASINGVAPMSGHSVGWPVLSNDGNTLYFLSYFGKGLVVQSERDKSGVFGIGLEIDEYTLGGPEGAYKLVNGLASDQRAIFFFDQATSHQMALFRSEPGAPFYDLRDLGERRGATPNADCSVVYSSRNGSLVAQPTE